MTPREEPADGGDGGRLLSRISTEMVRAQKEFFGKGPDEARSYFVDDMLFVVMTIAERTMLDFGEQDLVRSFRQTFENRMAERLTTIIEELTDRKVITYQSQVLFDPARVIEIFVFDDRARADLIAATARAQLDQAAVGVTRAEDVELD